jgi:hypothetical protein
VSRAAADAAAVPAMPAAVAPGAAAAAVEVAAVAIEPALHEVVLEEIAALCAAVREPRTRAVYEELAAAVAAGEVPPELVRRLETVLEMSLSTGRARRQHGASHEAALLRLFFETGTGRALRQSAAGASRALAALAGQRLEAVSVAAQAPGLFRLELATERCQLTIEVGREGVAVTSLGVEI